MGGDGGQEAVFAAQTHDQAVLIVLGPLVKTTTGHEAVHVQTVGASHLRPFVAAIPG